MEREIRALAADLAEVRLQEEDGGRFVLSGFAAVFNSLSHDLGGFRERIKPGAFRRALAEAQDVVCVPDHNYQAATVLGRTSSGTLKLRETDQGLKVRVELPDTATGRDIIAVAKRGDLRGMSFAFSLGGPDSEQWTEENGLVVREIDDLNLFDVSPVVFPAYPATSMEVMRRALEFQEQQQRSTGYKPHLSIRKRKLEILKKL